MENNSKFFKNNSCEHFPCHKGIDEFNCLFCYCPFYAWEVCPGKNYYKDRADGSRVKVCTDCTFPHEADNYERVIEILKMGKEKYAISRENLACKFYGIGVGPGEPELITKKAERLIKKVDVLILPAKDKESCRAYTIAEKMIPFIQQKECVFMPFPMSMAEPELTEFHRLVADRVEEFLQAGKSVGFLSIGDVTIYSTFAYVEKIVRADGYDTEVINGITSFQAAAARVGIPLTLGDDELHIIPGSADVKEALCLSGTLVFMKSGKRLVELKAKILEYEKDNDIQVYAVSNCGMENEMVSIGTENISVQAGYLTVVIVNKK